MEQKKFEKMDAFVKECIGDFNGLAVLMVILSAFLYCMGLWAYKPAMFVGGLSLCYLASQGVVALAGWYWHRLGER